MNLAREYLGFLATIGVLILDILALIVVGREEIFGTATGRPIPGAGWFDWIRRLDSGLLGAGATFVSLRMGYLVWRDLDIVKLQKSIVDKAASQAHQADQNRLAEEKRERLANAGLRSDPTPPPKNWGDT